MLDVQWLKEIKFSSSTDNEIICLYKDSDSIERLFIACRDDTLRICQCRLTL